MQQQRFLELDALRGFAAILVVLFHCVLSAELWHSVFLLGTAGVDLFFMISGFVILLSIQNVSGAKQFIINRFSRLYPTYWTVVSFTFLLIIGMVLLGYSRAHVDLVQYLANLTMFQYYFNINNLDGPYWTMIIEMLFYIFILILYRFNWLRHLALIGLVLSVSTSLLCNYFFHLSYVAVIMRQCPLLPFLPLFIAGSLFYKLHTTRTHMVYNYVLIVILMLCQISLFRFAGRSNYYISLQQYSILLGCFFLLFVLFLHGKLRWIVNPVSLFLGKISYALYLVHQYITLVIILPFFMDYVGLSFWVTVVCIALPMLAALAAIITYCVEVPLSRKLKLIMNYEL